MRTFVSLMIEPTAPIKAGLHKDVARIELGEPFQTLQMHGGTPAEQAAWLRRLAAAADALAEQIELPAAEAVS